MPAPVLEPAAKRLAGESGSRPRIYEMAVDQARAQFDEVQSGEGVAKPDPLRDTNGTRLARRLAVDALKTAGGPHYGPLLTMDAAQLRDSLSGHVELGLEVARNAIGKMRPTGTLIFMGDSGSRRVAPGIGIASAVSAVMPPFVAAPISVT